MTIKVEGVLTQYTRGINSCEGYLLFLADGVLVDLGERVGASPDIQCQI
jgi:hypothetical protein